VTLGAAIVEAHRAIAEAEGRRADLIRQARERGVSLRAIARLLDVVPSTVMRWGGEVESRNDAALDEAVR
jgi:transposase-like protein